MTSAFAPTEVTVALTIPPNATATIIGVTDTMWVGPEAVDLVTSWKDNFRSTLEALGFSGKIGETVQLTEPGSSKVLIVTGLGGQPLTAESLRRIAANSIRVVHGGQTVAVALPTSDDQGIRAVAEGVTLGGYVFQGFRQERSRHPLASIVIVSDQADDPRAAVALSTARIVSKAVNNARDWVNAPPANLTPKTFAERAAAAASHSPAADSLTTTIWKEDRLRTENCGGLLGVGSGSINPPRMVQITYEPTEPVARVALVGKGITFDSGGLSIKTSAGMTSMKFDMAGAASVIAATVAIAELGLPVHVTCFAPMAENMPSGSATRPGDVITIRGGTSVEIVNTDAEGRLVLADALVLASEGTPDLIVDVATLTGACVTALGFHTSGVMSNDKRLLEDLPSIAEAAGESVWALPITDPIRQEVRSSQVADLRQVGPKAAGDALFAAAFLETFVKNHSWVHFDIAGTAFNEGAAFDYTPSGATGASVRTLVQLVSGLASGSVGWTQPHS